VHCSAGIGRTGTLIALHFLLQELLAQREQSQPFQASVFATVRNLREQRAGAVQTLEQYEFIYSFVSLFVSGKFNA